VLATSSWPTWAKHEMSTWYACEYNIWFLNFPSSIFSQHCQSDVYLKASVREYRLDSSVSSWTMSPCEIDSSQKNALACTQKLARRRICAHKRCLGHGRCHLRGPT
jgi:hypothetical protein